MPITFVLVELVAFLMAGVLLYEAWRAGASKVSTLLVGMLFGLAIEVFFVTQYSGYEYGHFLVQFLIDGSPIPLWVAAGWGSIIFTSMAATDRMGFAWWARPILDGLLAVSLDFTLDPLAEALGWWHWTRPGQFFNVPCDNFIGWVLIVSSFSFFTRLGFHFWPEGVKVWRDVLIPLVAVLPSVGLVAGAQVLLERIYPHVGEPLTFVALASVFLLITLVMTRNVRAETPPAWFLTGVPAVYHGLMLALLVGTGVGVQLPEALVGLPLAAISSLFAFRFPRCSHAE